MNRTKRLLKNLLRGLPMMVIYAARSAALPNGSTELQNIPAPTVPAKKIPQLTSPASSQSELIVDASEQKIAIQSFKIVGNTAFTELQLLTSLSLPTDQHQWGLSELRQLAQKLTSYYRERGYFLAQAYLPQQDIIDGQVTIAVLEGRLGSVQVQNQTQIQESVAHANAHELGVGQLVDIKSLERQVLLINDLPGVEAKSLLGPGQEVGTADLTLILTPTPRIGGVATLDNLGGAYTGVNRLGANLVLNEPLGLGDMMSVYGLTAGPGLSFTRLGYQEQYQAFTLGLSKSSMRYQLGDAFASLGGSGTMDINGLTAAYAIVKTRDRQFNLSWAFDDKSASDQVATTSYQSNKRVKASTYSLQSDFKDKLLVQAQNKLTVSYTDGSVDLQTPDVLASDMASAQSNGNYGKLALNFNRTEAVTATTQLKFKLNAQWATKNLDATEKVVLGGDSGVRAYPSGEATGDQGFIVNAESQTLMPGWSDSFPGQLQLGGFIDAGSVKLSRAPWTAGNNSRTLAAAGLLLHWIRSEDALDLKASLAFKVGSEVAQSAPDSDWRAWLTLTKFF